LVIVSQFSSRKAEIKLYYFDLLLFGNRTIFCQIPAKFCAISPQNQKNMWVFGRIFCENLAENVVPFHHKYLREFGRKIFDFVVI
jgi:ribosome biogenesis protein Nip4